MVVLVVAYKLHYALFQQPNDETPSPCLATPSSRVAVGHSNRSLIAAVLTSEVRDRVAQCVGLRTWAAGNVTETPLPGSRCYCGVASFSRH